jgi:hypothetical protein
VRLQYSNHRNWGKCKYIEMFSKWKLKCSLYECFLELLFYSDKIEVSPSLLILWTQTDLLYQFLRTDEYGALVE